MKKSLFLLTLLTWISTIFAQDILLINVYNRSTTSLNGDWKYIIDPFIVF